MAVSSLGVGCNILLRAREGFWPLVPENKKIRQLGQGLGETRIDAERGIEFPLRIGELSFGGIEQCQVRMGQGVVGGGLWGKGEVLGARSKLAGLEDMDGRDREYTRVDRVKLAASRR